MLKRALILVPLLLLILLGLFFLLRPASVPESAQMTEPTTDGGRRKRSTLW